MKLEDQKSIPVAKWGDPKHSLSLGNFELPCYVLEDGRRVLAQAGMIKTLGLSRGGSGGTGGDRLAKFIGGERLKPYISQDILTVTDKPIKFRTPRGVLASAYEAIVLVDICEAILKAKDDGVLQKQQLHVAKAANIIIRSLAKVGINALIDEVTGYQEIRDKDALQKILEKYISIELMKWQKRFPDEFYQLIFKLNNWQWKGRSINPPQVVGRYTKDIIYERLAPGVITELEKKNPPDEKGIRKAKHHQWLTPDVGDPKLNEHIHGVMALMRASANWSSFKRLLARAYPKPSEERELDLDA